MALHTETATRTRLVTPSKNACQQCGAWLLAPDWSEYLNRALRASHLVMRRMRLSVRDCRVFCVGSVEHDPDKQPPVFEKIMLQ